MAWQEKSEGSIGYYCDVLVIASQNKVIANPNSYSLFENYRMLQNIENLEY